MNIVFGNGDTKLTGPLTDGTQIRQSFTAEGNILVSVSVMLSTYCATNPGRIIAEILDMAHKSIASCHVDTLELRDNRNQRFMFNVSLKPGLKYEIRLRTFHCRSGMAPTAHYGTNTHHGYMYIGSKMISGELLCKFSYKELSKPKGKWKLQKPSGEASSEHISGLVSVVVPHYNCPKLLAKCLASLSKQTYNGLEVIIVDDGSDCKPAVQAVVDAYEPILPGVVLEMLPENRGAPAARNVGAALASGEYLIFVDSDCEIYPKSIQTMLETLMDRPDVAFAYGGFRWGNDVVAPRPFDIPTLRSRNYVTTMSLMRREVFPGFDENLKRHQDWDLWLTIVENGGTGFCTGKMLFETPRRDGSISTGGSIGIRESMSIVRAKHGIRSVV